MSTPSMYIILTLTCHCQADNTCREGKNQFTATWSMVHVAKGLCDTISHPFSRVGHTHNEQDERFHVLSGELASAKTLEDPDAFMNRIRERDRPIRNCKAHVEKLDATYDFKKLFHALGIAVSGLVPTQKEKDVAHMWRFIRRADLSSYWQENLSDGAEVSHIST